MYVLPGIACYMLHCMHACVSCVCIGVCVHMFVYVCMCVCTNKVLQFIKKSLLLIQLGSWYMSCMHTLFHTPLQIYLSA